MEIKQIYYLDLRIDAENDCLDVLRTLENDVCYMVEVTTPKFFYIIMEKCKSDFVLPGYPYIIVQS